jgi:hypothetical protein
MSSRPSPSDSLPLSVCERINENCDRFEQAWKEGRRPRIEGCLGEIEDAYRPALLHELLHVEVQCRRGRDEAPAADGYRDRFPGCADLYPSLLLDPRATDPTPPSVDRSTTSGPAAPDAEDGGTKPAMTWGSCPTAARTSA